MTLGRKSRTSTAATLAAALLCTCAATAADASAPGNQVGANVPPDPESVAVSACHSSVVQADRYATFSAQMTANRRTHQMWIRFTLLERLSSGGATHQVPAPGLGVWEKSAPGVGVFEANKSVTNLVAPATFRAVVSFRWYDAHHRLLMHARKETSACTMP